MRRQLLLTPLKWLLTLGLLGSLLYGLFLIHAKMRAERDREENRSKAEEPQKEVKGIVKIEEEEAERYGLETATARARQWYEQATVYGRVVPNPQATTEVRSPFAGTLRSDRSGWPITGKWFDARQPLGWVDIRVGPDVRLDLQNKLAEARVKQRGAEEEVKVQQDRVNSLKVATSQEIIARNELDAALVQLAQARTQLATARAAAELWQQAIQEVQRHKGEDSALWSQRLIAPADGQVIEVVGRPGSAVEAGALVLQLVDFRRPLVRLDFPPEILTHAGPPLDIEVHVPSFLRPGLSGLHTTRSTGDPPRVKAHLVAPAPHVDETTQLVSYLYAGRLDVEPAATGKTLSGGVWRPGREVTARVRVAGAVAQPAVAVPADAVLYHEGRSLVYVRIGEEMYERREVRLLGRDDDGRWVVAVREEGMPGGVAPDESVVSRRAQVLLSREFLVAAADND